MNNELKIFTNEEFGKIRTVLIEDEPWFVGKDVATALGYSDTKQAIRINVQEDDKKHLPKEFFKGCTSTTLEISNFGATVINESGLYALIFGSKLEEAKKFKHWVTSEVLPSIRKTGSYHMPKTYKQALKELLEQVEENERLQIENKEKDRQIAEMQPKISYYDMILSNKSLLSTTQIAKDYGMSAKSFNKLLHSKGIQYKQADQWFLYAKYHTNGYVSSETFTTSNGNVKLLTKWTQKGRLFLYDLLKQDGILPIIEQDTAF